MQKPLVKGHHTAPCHPEATTLPQVTPRTPDCPKSPQGLLPLSPKEGSVAGRVPEEQAAPEGSPSPSLSSSRSNPPRGNAIPWEHSRLARSSWQGRVKRTSCANREELTNPPYSLQFNFFFYNSGTSTGGLILLGPHTRTDKVASVKQEHC